MEFKDKLKDIRKQKGLSQEALAEEIGVSRQAITKWETGKGLPDIENMKILAEIFKTTLDELISQVPLQLAQEQTVSTYQSETIYDIDENQHFDIDLPAAALLRMISGDDEKLHILLYSDTLSHLDESFKVQLDHKRKRLDVICVNKKAISKDQLYQELCIEVSLPKRFGDHCEVDCDVKELYLDGLNIKRLEFDGDAACIDIKNCQGSIEFAGKSDYDVTIDQIRGTLDFYQIKAKTTLHINKPAFQLIKKGRGCQVYWKHGDEIIEETVLEECEDTLCFNGIKAELVIDVSEVLCKG